MSATIALVEDDRNILSSVAIALQAEGFATRPFTDGEEALAAIFADPPDLVISDIKMPRLDGLELVRRLRERLHTPVIFLTSKDDEMDEAIGLAMGADDYITKPFSHRLLIARIRSVLRRVAFEKDDARMQEAANAVVTRGPLALEPARHRVAWRGEPVTVTVTEFMILEALAAQPGAIRTREQLLQTAYPGEGFVDDRTVDSHIKRLRKKFRAVDPDFDAIETLYGAGYRLAAL